MQQLVRQSKATAKQILQQVNRKQSQQQIQKEEPKFDYQNKFVSANKLQKFEIKQKESILKKFEDYTQKILPQMEEEVEMRLIARQLKNVKDESVRSLVVQSYSKRRLLVEAEPELKEQEPKFQMLQEEFSRVARNIYSPVDIQEHSVEDIGLYNHFPVADLDTYFRYGIFGDFKNEIMYTQQLTMMCTKEAFQLAQYIRLNPTLPIGQNIQSTIPMQADKEYTLGEYKALLQNEQQFLGMFKLLSNSLLDVIDGERGNELAKRLFSMSHLFDCLVSIVLMSMRHVGIRESVYLDEGKEVMTQVVQQVLNKVDKQEANGMLFKKTLKQIESIEITTNGISTVIDLKQNVQEGLHKYRPHRLHKFGISNFSGQNSGALIHGSRGTGKSGVLAYLSLLGHKSEMIVMSVVDVRAWTQTKMTLTRHHKTGLFCQFGLAADYLKHVLECNRELLAVILTDMGLYGQMSVSGQHSRECASVPNTYNKDRDTYFQDHKQFYVKDEQKKQEMEDIQLEQHVMSIRLARPKTLLEIVEFGIANPMSSICALGELLEQLYNMRDKKVVITVDNYNWLFRPSVYPSYRYSSDNGLNGYVPPNHLALARLFIEFDGHRIRNGFKVVASGHKHLYKHSFDPSKIHFGRGYAVEMKGLEVEEFANLMEHYNHHNMYTPHSDELTPVTQVHMEAQGNWEEAFKIFSDQLRDLR